MMSALRKAHFPKPWNSLKRNAKRDLVLTVSKWDEERKKSDPPVVIEDATPTRDLEAKLEQLPHARLLAGMAFNPAWRNAFRRDAVYEVRSRKDKRGVDLISDVLPFGRPWYDTPDNAIGYAMHSSRSHDAVIRVRMRLAT